MGRAVLYACLPWLALWVLSCACLWLLVRVNRGRFRFRRLWCLHRDQGGSAQSLSFVLTLPLFIVVLFFIVQVSQLMIGTIVVHYAAFAAARAAIVWIPARMASPFDPSSVAAENCVGEYAPDPDTPAENQNFPNDDDLDIVNFHPTSGGVTYRITQLGPKEAKILPAAWIACLPISPSRDLGLSLPGGASSIANTLKEAYHSLAPAGGGSAPAGAVDARLEHKLAYAIATTFVEMKFYHGNEAHLEPPLTRRGGVDSTVASWDLPYNPESRFQSTPENELGRYEFRASNLYGYHEIGCQDPITVKVTHYFALLPGIGRFLATRNEPPPGGSEDATQAAIQADTQEARAKAAQMGIGLPEKVYMRRIEATCTLGNEGDKSVMGYGYPSY
jgi:hypothetical protein